jgi:hypothetical protein
MSDTLNIEGILRIYEVPDELLDKNLAIKWWRHIRKKGWEHLTIDDKEREGKLVVEEHNMIMSAGRTQMLYFIGASGSTTAFSQYYAVGTGTIYSVNTGDSSLAGELFRAIPASFSVVGNAVTISTPFSTSQGNGTYTNSGLFGSTASSTPGSGVLMTHLLYSYTKTSASGIFNDYTLTAT